MAINLPSFAEAQHHRRPLSLFERLRRFEQRLTPLEQVVLSAKLDAIDRYRLSFAETRRELCVFQYDLSRAERPSETCASWACRLVIADALLVLGEACRPSLDVASRRRLLEESRQLLIRAERRSTAIRRDHIYQSITQLIGRLTSMLRNATRSAAKMPKHRTAVLIESASYAYRKIGNAILQV